MAQVNPDIVPSTAPPGAPPSYDEVMSTQLTSSYECPGDQQLFRRDFCPTWNVHQSLFIKATVNADDMTTLVGRASSWLQSRNDIYLIKCETVTKVLSADSASGGIDSALWMEPLFKTGPKSVIVRHLRLWYRKLPLSSPKPSNHPPLAMHDVVPSHQGVTLDVLIQAANRWLAMKKCSLVTVETLCSPVRITSYTPGRYLLETRNESSALIFKPNKRSVFFLRIFYFAQDGGPREELRLGLRDFMPSTLGFSSPNEAMHHVSTWLGRRNVNILNIQTVKVLAGRRPSDCYQERPAEQYPQKTSSRSYQFVTRIAYSYINGNDTPTAASSPVSCVVFSPSKVSIIPTEKGQYSMTFKTFPTVLERLQIWLNKSASDKEVISIETFPVQALTSEEHAGATREKITYHHGEETWLDTLRVYIMTKLSQLPQTEPIPSPAATPDRAPVSGYATVYNPNAAIPTLNAYSIHGIPGVSDPLLTTGQIMGSAGPYAVNEGPGLSLLRAASSEPQTACIALVEPQTVSAIASEQQTVPCTEAPEQQTLSTNTSGISHDNAESENISTNSQDCSIEHENSQPLAVSSDASCRAEENCENVTHPNDTRRIKFSSENSCDLVSETTSSDTPIAPTANTCGITGEFVSPYASGISEDSVSPDTLRRSLHSDDAEIISTFASDKSEERCDQTPVSIGDPVMCEERAAPKM